MKNFYLILALLSIFFGKGVGQSITLNPAQSSSFYSKVVNNQYGNFTTTIPGGASLNFRLSEPDAATVPSGFTLGSIQTHPAFFGVFSENNTDMNIGARSGAKIHFDVSTGRTGFFAEPLVNPIDFLPKSTFHFRKAESNVSPNINSHLFLENDNNLYLGFGVPNIRESGILFGKPDKGSASGGIIYNNSTGRNALQFRTLANVTQMMIDSVGNVGIGRGKNNLISAQSILHLNNNGTTPTKLTLSHNFPTNSQNLEISLDSLDIAKIISQREGDLVLGTNNQERVRIDLNGYVGIQESKSPINAPLHINRINPEFLLTRQSDPNNGLRIRMGAADLADIINEKNNSLRFGTNNSIKMILSTSGQLSVGNISQAAASIHAHQDIVSAKTVLKLTNGVTGTTGTDGLDLGYQPNSLEARLWNYENSSLVLGTNDTKRFSIISNGNVAIGGHTPSAKLDVSGDFALSIRNNGDIGTLNNLPRQGSSILRMHGQGSVNITGIEAASDGAILHIITTANVTQLTFENDSNSSISQNRILSGNSSLILGDGAATLIYDATTNRWRVISVHQ